MITMEFSMNIGFKMLEICFWAVDAGDMTIRPKLPYRVCFPFFSGIILMASSDKQIVIFQIPLVS